MLLFARIFGNARMSLENEAASHIKVGFFQGLGFTLAGLLVALFGVLVTIVAHHPIPILAGVAGGTVTAVVLRRRWIARRRLTLSQQTPIASGRTL